MRKIRWLLGALVLVTACQPDRLISIKIDDSSSQPGSGTVLVTGVTVTSSPNITLSIGVSCTNTTSQIVVAVAPANATNTAVSYTVTSHGSVMVSSTGLVTALKAGTDTVYVTSVADASKKAFVVVTVSGTSCASTPACPNGFSSCSGARWSDAGMTPQDTTYTFSHKRHVKGLTYIPSGVSTEILVRSALGCEAAASTPQVIATSLANVYAVDVELQAINICSDSTVFKLKADSTQKKAVHVTVVSAPGSVRLNPPTTIGGVGATGKYTCTVSGLADLRCWFYSTNPLVVSIVQKDTTYTAATFPWPAGANIGGTYKNLSAGSAGICTFSPSNPAIADCKNHVVSSGSALMAGSGLMAQAELQEWAVPEVLRVLTKP
ncbi:MAG: Ig-like domain-containing protein [Minisyncoccia bacterium]